MPEIKIKGDLVSKQYENGLVSTVLYNREKNNLRYLQKFSFVPRMKESCSKCIKMKKIEGDFIHHLNAPSPKIVSNLRSVIALMHKAWIFHLDLRQRKNILISPDNDVYLIDFESCIRLPKCGLLRPVYELLHIVDKAGLLRLKARYFPDMLSVTEKRCLALFNRLRILWFIRPFVRRKGDI